MVDEGVVAVGVVVPVPIEVVPPSCEPAPVPLFTPAPMEELPAPLPGDPAVCAYPPVVSSAIAASAVMIFFIDKPPGFFL
jgi:hypothetical protein